MDLTKLDIWAVTLEARWSVTSGCTDIRSNTTCRERQATWLEVRAHTVKMEGSPVNTYIGKRPISRLIGTTAGFES